MNQYGSQAMEYWRQWLPNRFSQIPDPKTFFAELGEQAANQIAQLSDELAGNDPPDENYMTKLGRLNATRMQAKELVLRELILLPPEPGTDPDEPETRTSQRDETDEGWIPLVEDPNHPYWMRQE